MSDIVRLDSFNKAEFIMQQKISQEKVILLLSIIISVSLVLGIVLFVWKIRRIERPIAVNPIIKEFCDEKILENCDSKKIILKGDLKYIPKGPIPILTNIENREVKYVWNGGVFLIWPNNEIPNILEGTSIAVIGKVFKGGQPCSPPGRPEQCLAPYHATQIKVEKYEIIKEKTAIDPRCGQKIITNPVCSGMGYGFDSDKVKCVVYSPYDDKKGCGANPVFNSLEECQKTCENNIVSRNELKFETIIKDLNSNQTTQSNGVIKSEGEWVQALQKTNAELPAPVDFSKDMIIAVFQGEKNTGGYNIEINKIIEKENVIEVTVIETSPGRRCMVTKAFTSPFHIVKIQKSNKEVVFKTEKVVTECE